MTTRMDILRMLSQGEIDVDRAAEMLSSALDDMPPAPPPPPPSDAPLPPEPPPARAAYPPPPPPPVPQAPGNRWLHIHVSDLASGRSRVRVNVPLGLVKFGLKLGARFTDELDADTLRDVMDALDENPISGTLVEVEDESDNERVHIYVD